MLSLFTAGVPERAAYKLASEHTSPVEEFRDSSPQVIAQCNNNQSETLLYVISMENPYRLPVPLGCWSKFNKLKAFSIWASLLPRHLFDSHLDNTDMHLPCFIPRDFARVWLKFINTEGYISPSVHTKNVPCWLSWKLGPHEYAHALFVPNCPW